MIKYIDRDKLIKAIQTKEAEPSYQHINEDWCVGLIMAEDIVWEQPTIEPKKGKWIKCISQFGWRCSACNQIDKYAYSYTLGEGDYNTLQDYFCPNCGADMR